MFAGVWKARGEDAWRLKSRSREEADPGKEDVSGDMADVFKCFDQILRELLQELLEVGGMPDRVLKPYLRYIQNLRLYNDVAGSIGQPYGLPCGIPQGCPLSMLYVAFLFRPWIIMMREFQANPRVLADDIMPFTGGLNMSSSLK